jgi:hypothetical protein
MGNFSITSLNSITHQHGHNSHMQTVNIAELKNQLSACLHRVRAGEELLIRDRNIVDRSGKPCRARLAPRVGAENLLPQMPAS